MASAVPPDIAEAAETPEATAAAATERDDESAVGTDTDDDNDDDEEMVDAPNAGAGPPSITAFSPI
jgi:hypothetical protein